jgi:hypothetical protein
LILSSGGKQQQPRSRLAEQFGKAGAIRLLVSNAKGHSMQVKPSSLALAWRLLARIDYRWQATGSVNFTPGVIGDTDTDRVLERQFCQNLSSATPRTTDSRNRFVAAGASSEVTGRSWPIVLKNS